MVTIRELAADERAWAAARYAAIASPCELRVSPPAAAVASRGGGQGRALRGGLPAARQRYDARMKQVVLLAALAGCVTTAAIARPDRVSIPLLLGAAAADLVVTAVVASQLEHFSATGSIATGLAVTGIDVGIGCILGACNALKL
jgi:hypothetical protein